MSRNRVPFPVVLRSSLAAVLAVASSGLAGANQYDPCAGAAPVELNSSHRGHGAAPGEPSFIRLDIPSAGILSVDVAVPGSARALPKLGLADVACGASEDGSDVVVLERSAGHLLLAAKRAGSKVFRVASQDPALTLREFKLNSGFSPDAARPLAEKEGEDEEIIELEADPLIYVDPAEIRSLPARLHELCGAGDIDDHGDTFTCATFLPPGRDVVGELRNGWGDDGDVFRIVVGDAGAAKLWTLEVETTGSIDTFGALYDQFGTRLEKSDGGGGGDNFRIVRVLPAGTYYVRIEGRHGAEGSFGLRVDSSPW